MYRRSYKYTTTPEQREMFINKIEEAMDDYGGFIIQKNDYPYDMCRDKKVKTKHLTMFYYDRDDIEQEIEEHISLGYTVQINSSDNQTIPEIQHLHFIKIIDD